jgi:acyl carrier protein
MEINEFAGKIAMLFEETDTTSFNGETKFKELDEYSSLMALNIMAMVDEEYDIKIKPEDIRNSFTIDELYKTVISK